MTCTTRHVFTGLLLLASAAAAGAQQPPARSPDVHADRRVTVRLRAPNAQEVVFASDGAPPAPMVRDSSGVWSYTTAPLAPDIYTYTFRVDGVTIPDPQNPEMKPVFRMSLGQSLLHVPGPDSLSWEMRDVPHGAITEHFYTSDVIGDRRNYHVYTPPNHDPRRAERYPVLYLLHGLSDDASGWVSAGRANVILDNLIAARRATPMVVVMTLGYGAPQILDGFYWGRQIDSALWRQNTTRFSDALLKEVIPQVERQIGVGREDFLHAEYVRLRDWLRSKNVVFEWVETPGGHTWMIWRRYLTDFLPRLFR